MFAMSLSLFPKYGVNLPFLLGGCLHVKKQYANGNGKWQYLISIGLDWLHYIMRMSFPLVKRKDQGESPFKAVPLLTERIHSLSFKLL